MILKELSKFDCNISVIPNGLEKYLSFSLNNLVFIDSMLLMNSTLDKLVKNLSSEDFKYLSEVFSGEKLELVQKKGVHPYEYFNSFKKFKESKLPDIDKFFSSLKDCGISEKEYQRALDVWKVFGIKTLGEYHDLYLKTDVLLLCDAFEKFISVYLEYYCLDPCHYFSSPGLSWYSMLKMTGIQLEKINNSAKHLFLEKGMRGGISYVSKRHSKSDDNTTIMYWDANKYLHDSHRGCPLCPEKIEISCDMLSKYCSEIADQYGIKVGGVKKLIPNLGDKVKYVVHYKNLEYYLSLGIKLVKINRTLSFKQSKWLKSYVDYNTEKRKQSSCEFDKNFFKLIINCVYGKLMENIRKRIN